MRHYPFLPDIRHYLMKALKIIGICIIVWALASSLAEGYAQIGWGIFLAVLPIILLVWIFMYVRKRNKVKDKI